MDMTLNPIERGASRGELLRWAGWFAVANALVMVLVALRYLDVGNLSDDGIGRLFGIAMFPAHAVSMAVLLCLPVFLLALIWPRRHAVAPLALAIGAGGTMALLADTVVYQQYRFHLNSAVLSLFFSDASDETFVFSGTMQLQAGLAAIAVVAGQWLLAHLIWRYVARTPGRRHGYAVAGATVALFIGTNLFHAYADAAGDTDVIRQTRLLPLYEPLTAKGFLEDYGFDVATTVRTAPAIEDGPFNYPRLPLETRAPDERPNILFIVIDSWRFDTMNERVTPHIAAFAEDSLRFNRHFSGGNATRMGMFSLFYGIPGPYWHSALATGTRAALVTRLEELGYHFAIYRNAPLSSPEFHRTIFDGMTGLRMTSDGNSSPARDIDANRDFLDFLNRRDPDRPFFGLLFYDSPHAYDLPDDAPAPFQPSWDGANYLALDDDTDPEGFFNLYRNSVHFVDGLVGETLDRMRALGLTENTIVVVTSDHGQEFNDTGQGYWGHNGNYSRYQTQVPFIVHWPGRGKGEIDYLTSHFDVAPTLMAHVLGVDNAHEATGAGRDLFTPGDRLPLVMATYRGYAAFTGDRFLTFPPFGGVDVYDSEYRLLENAAPSASAIRDTLDQLRRFHRTGT